MSDTLTKFKMRIVQCVIISFDRKKAAQLLVENKGILSRKSGFGQLKNVMGV